MTYIILCNNNIYSYITAKLLSRGIKQPLGDHRVGMYASGHTVCKQLDDQVIAYYYDQFGLYIPLYCLFL